MNFEQTPEFSKELKRFTKKWRSLPSDLEALLKVLSTLYVSSNPHAEHIRETFFANKNAAVLQSPSKAKEVVKVRLDSRALNKDMLRVIYIRENDMILLLELYIKSEKPREDRARIKGYLSLGKG